MRHVLTYIMLSLSRMKFCSPARMEYFSRVFRSFQKVNPVIVQRSIVTSPIFQHIVQPQDGLNFAERDRARVQWLLARGKALAAMDKAKDTVTGGISLHNDTSPTVPCTISIRVGCPENCRLQQW